MAQEADLCDKVKKLIIEEGLNYESLALALHGIASAAADLGDFSLRNRIDNARIAGIGTDKEIF